MHRENKNCCNLLQINETDDRYRHTLVVLTLIIILFGLVSGSCLVSRTWHSWEAALNAASLLSPRSHLPEELPSTSLSK